MAWLRPSQQSLTTDYVGGQGAQRFRDCILKLARPEHISCLVRPSELPNHKRVTNHCFLIGHRGITPILLVCYED